MKTFKKSMMFAVAIMTGLLASSVSAESVVGKSHTSQYSDTQCDGGVFTQVMYAGSKGHEMVDTFTESNTSFVWQINTPNSWVSTYNAFSNALTMPTLDYFSNGKPHNVSTIVVMGSKAGASVSSTVPSTYKRSDVAAQVVYHVERTRRMYKPGQDNLLQFLDFNNLGAGTQDYYYGKPSLTSRATYSDNECMQVHIGFCGDGIVDNSTVKVSKNINAPLNGGELCDPKDPNKVGRGNGGCSVECKPINKTVEQPKCNSQYNGQSKYALSQFPAWLNSSMSLCSNGTVSSFLGPDATGKYTWNCNGTAGTTPVNCSAQQLRCGDGKVQADQGEQCDPNDPAKAGWKDGSGKQCNASCKLEDKPVYDLALTKIIIDKKATYAPGDVINYVITVINQGKLTAKNIEITDYLPEGLELVSTDWKVVNGKVTKVIAGPILPTQRKSETLRVRIKSDFKGGSIKNIAEITKDNAGEYGTVDVDSTPDANPDNDCFIEDKHLINGNGRSGAAACTDATDEDDHDGEIIMLETPIYDLALTKTLSSNKTAFSLGDQVTFLITVINQGNKVAKNIEITDYLPAGLILKDSHWTLNNGKVVRMLTEEIKPGEKKQIQLNVEIDKSFKGKTIKNLAEISKDNAKEYGIVDVDSTPDTDPANDCFIEDKHIITGNGKSGSSASCTNKTDEDDHDGVVITIESIPIIQKDLIQTGVVYKPGDLVGFRMPFKNTRSTTLTNVSVKDIMPLNLEYVSSEIHGVQGSTFRQYQNGGLDVIEYRGFNLAPNQEGYLLLTGRVKETNLQERINWVGIFENDIEINHDTEIYPLMPRNLMIDKTVDKKIVTSGDIVTYAIKVNVTEGEYAQLKVTDILPKGVVLMPNTAILAENNVEVRIDEFTTGKNTEGLDLLTWSLSFPNKIKKGQTFKIQFQAKYVGTESKAYVNTACVEEPNTQGTPICDAEDITPNPQLKIKKYVNNKLTDDGRQDVLMAGFAVGQTGYFTLEVADATSGLKEFTITDTVNGNLQYINSKNLLNDAFTGTFLRASSNVDTYKYTVDVKAEDLGNNQTKLTWKVVMTEGQFLPGDRYIVKFMAKVNGKHKNVATVDYPGGKDDDDASVDTEEVKLSIKKYVSAKLDGTYDDVSATISSNATAYFKLVVTGATNALTGFRVTDSLKNSDLLYLEDSEKLANNAFTGVITFGSNNPNKPTYTITPKVEKTDTHTNITWTVKMAEGTYFMPGDSLEIIFMTKKINNTENTAYVYYPKRDGTEGSDKDPASVTYSSDGEGGWSSGGGGRTPTCGDGYKNGYELCDLGRNGGTIGADGKLFSNSNEYNTAYAGYRCTASCGLEKNGEQIAPKCFNVQNGSISIMKGEVLPFYWNIEGKLGDKTVEQKQTWLKDNYIATKDKADGVEKIDISSMKCTFRVYAPGQSSKKGNYSYEFTTNCFDVNGWDTANGTPNAIKSWVAQNNNGWFGGSMLASYGTTRDVFDSLDDWDYPVLYPLSSKTYIKVFGETTTLNNGTAVTWKPNGGLLGEYKLALESINFNRCFKDEKGNVSCKSDSFSERVCEVDFSVTEPYMVQKSPYGIGNKATTALSKYMLMKGTSFMNAFFPTQSLDAKTYAAPKNMQSLFTTFKNKYQKLAKSVNGKKGLSKVPGKAIYFYEGSEDITSILGSDVVKKPFTLIASKGQNLTIKGSLNTNAMIMTQGTITFDASLSCNGNITKYGRAGQMVKGIFYAGAGFKSAGHENLKNTVANLNSGERCNYGNLHIKGVAIGDLSDVIAVRRSELYEWFSADSSKGSKEKADIVVNGASVLLDYNPDLRGNLPPGAEEFNKALEVYRK